MNNLRQAAQQALEFCEFLWRDVPLNDYSEDMRQDVESALRAALAQPTPEPVAWGVFEGENLHDFYTLREDAEKMAGYKGSHATVMPLYTAPPLRAVEAAHGITNQETN